MPAADNQTASSHQDSGDHPDSSSSMMITYDVTRRVLVAVWPGDRLPVWPGGQASQAASESVTVTVGHGVCWLGRYAGPGGPGRAGLSGAASHGAAGAPGGAAGPAASPGHGPGSRAGDTVTGGGSIPGRRRSRWQHGHGPGDRHRSP